MRRERRKKLTARELAQITTPGLVVRRIRRAEAPTPHSPGPVPPDTPTIGEGHSAPRKEREE